MTESHFLMEAMPEGFDFYHLGKVLRDEAVLTTLPPLSPALFENKEIVGFTIQGDARAVLLLLVDAGLDSSVYAELGNVIASRLVTNLYRQKNMDLLLSPPKTLSAEMALKLLNQQHERWGRQSYIHFNNNRRIRVEILVIGALGAEEKDIQTVPGLPGLDEGLHV